MRPLRPATEVLRHRDVADAVSATERAELAPPVQHAASRRAATVLSRAGRRVAAARSTPAARCASSCGTAVSRRALRHRAPQHRDPPRRRPGRRVRLDGAVRRQPAAAGRTSVTSVNRARTEVFTRRHPADPGHPRDAAPRRRPGARGGRPGGPGLVGRDPARRGAAGVPRPLGAAWRGARRGRRDLAATAGSAATARCSASRCAVCSRLAHRVVWVNPHQGKPGYAPVPGRDRRRPAVRRRLRRRPQHGDVRAGPGGGRRCVTCRPSCCRGGSAGETVGVATVVATFQSAPRPPGASMLVGPDGEAVGSVSGGCVEGAVYELAEQVVADRRAGAPALRRQRRRRVRGRPDLRRHPRRLRRGGRPGSRSPSSARSPPTSGPADRSRSRPCVAARRRRPARATARSSARGRPTPVRHARLERADDAVTADARGLLAAGRNETLHYGPDGQRRGEGMTVFVASYAPQAADARLRRDRLRRRGGPGRRRSSATR